MLHNYFTSRKQKLANIVDVLQNASMRVQEVSVRESHQEFAEIMFLM